jgi:hypothetical protein
MSRQRIVTRLGLAATAVAIAAGGLIAPSAAFATQGDWWVDELGRYNEIVYQGGFRDLPPDRLIHADCPTKFDPSTPGRPVAPYLDERIGTGGQNVGQGVMVSDDGILSLGFTRIGSLRYISLGVSGRAASGIDIRSNGAMFSPNPQITAHMVCTADSAFAWRG